MIETLFARASSSARLLEPPLGSLHLRVLENAGVVPKRFSANVVRKRAMLLVPAVYILKALQVTIEIWSRRRSSLLPKIKLCRLDRTRRRLLRCLILCGFVAFAPSLALGV